jgi:hypothetical protein
MVQKSSHLSFDQSGAVPDSWVHSLPENVGFLGDRIVSAQALRFSVRPHKGRAPKRLLDPTELIFDI